MYATVVAPAIDPATAHGLLVLRKAGRKLPKFRSGLEERESLGAAERSVDLAEELNIVFGCIRVDQSEW